MSGSICVSVGLLALTLVYAGAMMLTLVSLVVMVVLSYAWNLLQLMLVVAVAIAGSVSTILSVPRYDFMRSLNRCVHGALESQKEEGKT